MSESSDPQVPGYELLRPIGQGGAGTVYEAQAADDLGRRFAIKVFPPARRAEYERELKTLRAIEAARAAAGSHDLVETIAAAEEPQLAYVVMAYASGGDLQARVAQAGPLELAEAVGHMLPILRGLSLLHAEGLVHKDVKPANVLLGDDGQARLGDFGLTRALDAGPLSSAGTPGFCAPEVFRGRAEEADHRIDVYSAAATLYFLLTAEAPLPGRPDLFLLERRRVDRALQEVLFAALSDDPARRPPTAEAFRKQLEAWQQGELKTSRPLRPVVGWLLGAAVLALGVGGAALARSRASASDPPAGSASPAVEVAPTLASAAAPSPAPSAASPPASPPSSSVAPSPASPRGEPRWDGWELVFGGPELTWSSGSLRVSGGPSLELLPQAPLARARDAAGWIAAATETGQTVVVDPSSSPPSTVLRLPPLDAEAGLPALALREGLLARLMAWGDPDQGDVLQVYRLADGELMFDLTVPVATAVALLEASNGALHAALGTPDGRVVVIELERGTEVVTLRTHSDEVLGLAVEPERGWLLVLGDDRELGGDPGAPTLDHEPRLTLKAYPVSALLEGRATTVLESPSGAEGTPLPR